MNRVSRRGGSIISKQPLLSHHPRSSSLRLPTQTHRKMCLVRRRAILSAVLFICRLRLFARRRPRLTPHEKSLVCRVHAVMLQSGSYSQMIQERPPSSLGADLFGPGGELEGVSREMCYCSSKPVEMLSRMCNIIGIRSLLDSQLEEIALRVLTHGHRRKGPISSAMLLSVPSRGRFPQDHLWEAHARFADNERSAVTVDQFAKSGEILSAAQMTKAVDLAKSYHKRNCEDAFGAIATNGDHAAVDIVEIFTSMSEDGGRTLKVSSLVEVLKPHGIREQTLKRAMDAAGLPSSSYALTQLQFIVLMESLSQVTTEIGDQPDRPPAGHNHSPQQQLLKRRSLQFQDGNIDGGDDAPTNSSFAPGLLLDNIIQSPLHQSTSSSALLPPPDVTPLSIARKASVSFQQHVKSSARRVLSSAQKRLQADHQQQASTQEDEGGVSRAARALAAVNSHQGLKEFVAPQPSRKITRHEQCRKSSDIGYTPMLRNSLWRINDASAFALDPRTNKSIFLRSRVTSSKAVDKYAANATSHVLDHVYNKNKKPLDHSSASNGGEGGRLGPITRLGGHQNTNQHISFGASSIRPQSSPPPRDPPLSEVIRGGPSSHAIHRQNNSRPQTATSFAASSYSVPSHSTYSHQHHSSMNNTNNSSRPSSVMSGGIPSQSLLSAWQATPTYPETYTKLGGETRSTANAVLSVLKAKDRPATSMY